MNRSARERRFVEHADQRPEAYAQWVRQKFGFSPAGVEALLLMNDRLAWGGTLNAADVKTLQGLHPQVEPRQIATMAAALNAEHGPQRSDMFISALAGDLAGMGARFAETGQTFKTVKDLAEAHRVEAYADEINRRRDGGTVKAEPAERPVDPHSTREIISRQLEPKGARALVEAVERGDPHAVASARHAMADRLDRASHTLYDDGAKESASLRDTVDAAYTSAEVEAHAVDQGWTQPADA